MEEVKLANKEEIKLNKTNFRELLNNYIVTRNNLEEKYNYLRKIDYEMPKLPFLEPDDEKAGYYKNAFDFYQLTTILYINKN